MKTETFKGTVSSAYGETLPKSIAFDGSYDAYENPQEVRTGGDWPTDNDVVEFVNTKRKASARAKATEAALSAAGYEKPDLSKPEYRRKRMIADFVAMGISQDIATKQVDTILGSVSK